MTISDSKRTGRATLRGRIPALIAGLLLQAMMMALASAAAGGCEPCAQQQIENWPICSPEQIDAASVTTHVQTTGLIMKSGTFAREAAAPLPGRARLELSGLINTGGASCVSHIAQVMGEGNIFDRSLRQKMHNIFSLMAGDETAPDKQERRIVLQIYTPNIQVQQTGMLVDAKSIRHDGIGGWRPNGFTNLILQLPGTRAEDLEAGARYPAVAHYGELGSDPTPGLLYRDWAGRFTTYYAKGPPEPEVAAMLQTYNRKITEFQARRVDETGDEPLRGRGPIDFSRGAAFAGTQRYVEDATLKDHVTIDRITRAAIAGHFDVSGTGRVRTERFEHRFDNQTGQLIGDREIDSQESAGELRAQGHFQAPNYRNDGNVPLGSPVIVSGQGEPKDKDWLQLTGHAPGIVEHNVNWQEPRICVTFDNRIDLGSLGDHNFYLEYRDADGQLQTVAAAYVRASPRRVRLVPRTDLKDSVRYRVRLKAGENGIRGREGQQLDADYAWNFYTTVNLDDDEPVQGLSSLVEPREGVEAHVFQVSRDTALVPRKSTLTRIRAKWRERDDVDPEWQVKQCLADVRGKGADGAALYAEKKKVLIQRPDQYDAQDRRNAVDTVKLFGWRPGAARTPWVDIEIEPVTRCEAHSRVFKARRGVSYTAASASLKVAYYYVATRNPLGYDDFTRPTHDPDEGGVPDWVPTVTPAIVHQGAAYTTQNLPVVATHMRAGGVIAADTGLRHPRADGLNYSNLSDGPTDEYVAAQVYAALRGTTDADVILMIMGRGLQSKIAGYTYRKAFTNAGFAAPGPARPRSAFCTTPNRPKPFPRPWPPSPTKWATSTDWNTTTGSRIWALLSKDSGSPPPAPPTGTNPPPTATRRGG